VPKTPINSDFGSGTTIDPRVAQQAARAVAILVDNVDDARVFLDILGLIPPQPGFEPMDKRNVKNKRNQENYEMRKLRAGFGKASREEKYRKLGVTPEEIGEEPNESKM